MSSPLQLTEWESILESHPDQAFAQFLLCGISSGFRIGFDRSKEVRSAMKNMASALSHPEVVSKFLAEEIAAGRVVGPFPLERAQLLTWHINRFGIIPKGHRPGQWRLIVDLSSPLGASVNDGIDPARCSLKYTKVEQVAQEVLKLGVGTELAKADIKAHHPPPQTIDPPQQASYYTNNLPHQASDPPFQAASKPHHCTSSHTLRHALPLSQKLKNLPLHKDIVCGDISKVIEENIDISNVAPGTVAQLVAREVVFGSAIMSQCTPNGSKTPKALPQKELMMIKEAIFKRHLCNNDPQEN